MHWSVLLYYIFDVMHVLIIRPLTIPLKFIVPVLSITWSHHILSYRNKSIKDHVSSCREYWVPVALPQILILWVYCFQDIFPVVPVGGHLGGRAVHRRRERIWRENCTPRVSIVSAVATRTRHNIHRYISKLSAPLLWNICQEHIKIYCWIHRY